MTKTKLYRTVCAVLLMVLVMGIMSSCSSSKSISGSSASLVTKRGNNTQLPVSSTKSQSIDVKGLDAVTTKLLSEASSWCGTPYLYGGNTREGVDCSGYVLQVFKRSLDISLPRTSRTQQEYCKSVRKKDMVPGDLVFFATGGNGGGVSHVGIYIGDDRMIHSSSSKGVIVSDLNTDYYISHYHSSGRVERFYALASKEKSKPGKSSRVVEPKPEEPLMASVNTAGNEKKRNSAAKADKKTSGKKIKDGKKGPDQAERMRLRALEQYRLAQAKAATDGNAETPVKAKAPVHHAKPQTPSSSNLASSSSMTTQDYRTQALSNLE